MSKTNSANISEVTLTLSTTCGEERLILHYGFNRGAHNGVEHRQESFPLARPKTWVPRLAALLGADAASELYEKVNLGVSA